MLTPRLTKRTVRTPDGHLLWTGGLANGYPAAKHEGKTVYVRRLVWEEINGPVPEDAVVISTCGQRTCIEPFHLALTTSCLLYTSDAADDLLCVDLGGRRIIKKKKKKRNVIIDFI